MLLSFTMRRARTISSSIIAVLMVFMMTLPSFADNSTQNASQQTTAPVLTYQANAEDCLVPDFPAPQEYSITSQSITPGENHQVRAEFNVPEDVALSEPAMFTLGNTSIQVVGVYHDGRDVTGDWEVVTVETGIATVPEGSWDYLAIKQDLQSKLLAAGNYAVVFEQETVSSQSQFQMQTASDGRGLGFNYPVELSYKPAEGPGEEVSQRTNLSAYFTDNELRIAIERNVAANASSTADFKAGGAIYGIYNSVNTEEHDLVQTVQTDGSGLAVSAPLPEGWYYVKEISPSAGCLPNDVTQRAELYAASSYGKADKEGYYTVEFTVEAEKAVPEPVVTPQSPTPVPKTGESMPLAAIGVALACSTAVILLSVRRRRELTAKTAAAGAAAFVLALALSILCVSATSGVMSSSASEAGSPTASDSEPETQARQNKVMPFQTDWLASTGVDFPSQASIEANMFDIPSKIHVGDCIRVKAPRHSGELRWEGSSNIEVDGLSDDGGYIKVIGTGDVVLTAKSGAAVLGSSTSTAYPVRDISAGGFPSDAYIGNVLTLSTSDLLETDTAHWEIQDVSYSGKNAFGTAFLGEEPGKDGGELTCAKEGVYSFTLVVETEYGDVIRVPMSNNLHVRPVPDVSVTAPETAFAEVAFDVSAEASKYYPVHIGHIAASDVPEGAFDADGSLSDPGLLDGKLSTDGFADGQLTLPVGEHFVIAWTKDAIGTMFASSSKVIVSAYPEPTVQLSSPDITDGIASSGDLKINAEFSALGDTAELAIIDYYDQSAGKTEYSLPRDLKEDGGDQYISHKTYAQGNHLLVAQVKDGNGHDAYATLSFNVGGTSANGNADISASQTTTVVTDKVTFDGGKTYAFVDGFTFNVPAISGHSSGNQDWVEVEGIAADGSSTMILSREDAKTNTGLAQISAVKGAGTWTTTMKSDQAFSFDPAKYVQLKLTYYNAHESCLKQATEAMTYSTSYALTMDDLMLDALKKLFD